MITASEYFISAAHRVRSSESYSATFPESTYAVTNARARAGAGVCRPFARVKVRREGEKKEGKVRTLIWRFGRSPPPPLFAKVQN